MTASICNTPGCPNPAQPGTGRCPTHTRPPWRKGSSTRRQTLPKGWERLRAAVLARDGHMCQCPGCPRCTGPAAGRLISITSDQQCWERATDVDHIGHRDNHSMPNLRAMCGHCHAHKTSSSVSRGRG
jgi:5-methylcytosine-specific restriction enzyme A